jgi:hypothetical protein
MFHYQWHSFNLDVGAEAYGQATVTPDLCLVCHDTSCHMEPPENPTVDVSVGVRFCWGGCYSIEVWSGSFKI